MARCSIDCGQDLTSLVIDWIINFILCTARMVRCYNVYFNFAVRIQMLFSIRSSFFQKSFPLIALTDVCLF